MKINNEHAEAIIKLYETNSLKKIAELYNSTSLTIRKILEKNGYAKRSKGFLNMSKIEINVDYFKIIDSKDKAYWFGYLAADGSVYKNGRKTSLISKDYEIIEKFKQDIGSGHKISENKISDKRTNKIYTSYQIQITNEIFTNNLISAGLSNDKTDSFKFPNIDEKYYSYFIAGLFDGDGSVYKGSKNSIRINLISTIEVILFIEKLIFSKFGIGKLYVKKVTKNKPNVWKMYLSKDCYKFLDFIYQDDTFKYLPRKYELYLKYKK